MHPKQTTFQNTRVLLWVCLGEVKKIDLIEKIGILLDVVLK